MKKVKIISISLGIISLAFGLLKFVSPFKDWYGAQIDTSGLPQFAYAFGIMGEIIIGVTFLVPLLVSTISVSRKKWLLIFANTSLIIMMVVATIVHLIPTVPAEVLPLKIKSPVIPLIFGIVALINLINTIKEAKIIRK